MKDGKTSLYERTCELGPPTASEDGPPTGSEDGLKGFIECKTETTNGQVGNFISHKKINYWIIIYLHYCK